MKLENDSYIPEMGALPIRLNCKYSHSLLLPNCRALLHNGILGKINFPNF